VLPVVGLYFTAPHSNWTSSDNEKRMTEFAKELKIDLHW
jgi:hypothetical protein